MSLLDDLKAKEVRENNFDDERYTVKRLVKYNGLVIMLEHNEGDYRYWTDEKGRKGKTLMKYPYGFIVCRKKGADGDSIDVYLGPVKSDWVYVIHQNNPDTGRYDEDKVMLGFPSVEDAVEAYKSQYNRSGFFGGVTTYWINDFEDKVTHKRKSLL